MSNRADTIHNTSDSRLGRNMRRLGAAALVAVTASAGAASLAGAKTPSPDDFSAEVEIPEVEIPVPSVPPYKGPITVQTALINPDVLEKFNPVDALPPEVEDPGVPSCKPTDDSDDCPGTFPEDSVDPEDPCPACEKPIYPEDEPGDNPEDPCEDPCEPEDTPDDVPEDTPETTVPETSIPETTVPETTQPTEPEVRERTEERSGGKELAYTGNDSNLPVVGAGLLSAGLLAAGLSVLSRRSKARS